MEPVAKLTARFGRFVVIFSFVFLIFLLLFKHFGFAEKFANYFLLLSIFVVFVQMFKVKDRPMVQDSHGFFTDFPLLGWFVIVLAVFLVFRPIFSIGPVVWGDAPFFYHGAFKDFFLEPFAWESRGRLGVAIDLYWIYPLMVVYKGLGLLGLSNDLIIRLVFYFPAIFFAFLSPLLFTRYLGFSTIVSLFSVLVYVLNTYFILLIDGGQVGVALAYGLFPLALLELYKLTREQNNLQFFRGLFLFMLLVIADVRLAIIAILTAIFWVGLEHFTSFRKIRRQNFVKFALFGMAFLALSAYWLLPVVVVEPTTGVTTRSALQLISVLNPIFIFQPHWPLNEFGKISAPSWFFGGTLLLMFANLFFKISKRTLIFVFCFLIFVFLAKGDTGILSNLYALAVDKIPLGGAFRDSTKFFTPLLLFAGILIGISVQSFTEIFKKQVFSKAIALLVFAYLLFLIYPAIFGNMHGVLAGREFPKDLKVFADKVSAEDKFFRTAWFPEHHPFSFNTERKPALDAKTLADLRPLASLNVGTSDRFNFLHNKQFLQWFDILGVKYLVFSGDTRKVLADNTNEEDWNSLLNLAGNTEGLDKVEWGTSFPVYETPKSKPRVFAVDKVLAVVGSDDIYNSIQEHSADYCGDELNTDMSSSFGGEPRSLERGGCHQRLIDADKMFSIGNQGFVFFEDGKFDPRTLEQVSSNSAVLVFNQKEKLDLLLSFLSKFFVGSSASKETQWAVRTREEYLKWKFELLVNKIPTSEFDYGKGVAFSSQPNEKLVFNLPAEQDGEYILAIRHMLASGSIPLRMSFDNQTEEILTTTPGRFEWYIKETTLAHGKYDLVLENLSGFQVINVVALIPKEDWGNASELTEKMLSKFPVVNGSDLSSLSNWHEINYNMISPVEYKVLIPPDTHWLVFSDSYHPEWVFRADKNYLHSYPFYSAINGFYVSGTKEGEIIFKGQKYVRLGMYISLATLVLLASIFVWLYSRSRKK